MLATVVIPVKDGAPHLREVLPALLGQAVPRGFEILAIDSGSRDGSLSLLEEHGVRTLVIPPEEFDHGETRNLGAREARGDAVVFLTQDAVPGDAHLVARLVAALERDPRVAGAFARQRPRPDADPLTRRDIEGWVAAGELPRTVFVDDVGVFEGLPPLERYRMAAFDNVASAVRRELLLAHPFAATRFGEDLEWGLRMLRRGYGLAYVPDAVVVHSHARSARSLFRRNYLSHRLLRRLFGLNGIPDVAHLLRSVVGTLAGDIVHLARSRARVGECLLAPARSIAAVYGQYLGARDEARGRSYPPWTRGAR